MGQKIQRTCDIQVEFVTRRCMNEVAMWKEEENSNSNGIHSCSLLFDQLDFENFLLESMRMFRLEISKKEKYNSRNIL